MSVFGVHGLAWYIPPLSPVVDAVSRDGHDGEDVGNLFGALEALRIPMQYLAELFTAGDTAVVTGTQTEVNSSGVDRMIFTRVYVNGSRGWQLLSSNQSRNPYASAPGARRSFDSGSAEDSVMQAD